MIGMHKFRRDVDHKLRVLQHADKIGDVGKACRYFGVGRASFYRWRTAYRQNGLAGLENRKTAPKNPANRTAPEIVEKVLHLRKTYRLGPIRIVWYLARYQAITISDAGVYRILRRNGLSRLPGGTRSTFYILDDLLARRLCRHSRSCIDPTFGHQSPYDASHFVREGDHHKHRRLAGKHANKPRALRRATMAGLFSPPHWLQ